MLTNRILCLVIAVSFSSAIIPAIAQQPLPAEGDESQLLAVLDSDAELFDKAKACQRLAIIGTSKSVPALAALLDDENLAHYARIGLEANPSPAVDEAFRQSLGDLDGSALIGVINSIGVRRDAGAVTQLKSLTDDDSDEVAAAAIAALGAIATPEAVVAIQSKLDGRSSLRAAAADACLAAADRLLGEGKHEQAADIFVAVENADLPKHINIASRLGEIRAGDADPSELMKKYLASEDKSLFRIGLQLAHTVPGADATRQLLERMESLPAERRVLLIYALGQRGDRAALPALIEAAGSDDDETRVAAIEVLGTLGDASVVSMLIDAAASDRDALAEAARDSLAELDDDEVDNAVLRELRDSQRKKRVVLVEIVGRRGISQAIPILLQEMASSDAQLRDAAVDALGMTVGPDELPPMVDRMIGAGRTDVALQDALRKACQRMPDRDAAATVLLNRMNDAAPGAKAELLDLLIYVGGAKALEGIGAVAAGGDDALADAATQALGKWLTPDVAPVLLELATTGNEKYRIRCLRGYIRVIRQFGLRSGQRLQMSKTALKAATRDEERKLVLDTLTRFPSAAGLKVIMPHLGNPALSAEACKAAVSICEKIVDTDRKAVATAMPKVLAAIDNPELAQRARVVMNRAGAD